jgi:hypothetical protein
VNEQLGTVSAVKRENPALQNMKFEISELFLSDTAKPYQI